MQEQHHVVVFILQVLLKSIDGDKFDTFRGVWVSGLAKNRADVLLWNEGVSLPRYYFYSSLSCRREYSNVNIAVNYEIFFILMNPGITIDYSKNLQWVDLNLLLQKEIGLHSSLANFIDDSDCKRKLESFKG